MSIPRPFTGVLVLCFVAACGGSDSEPQMPQTFEAACALVPGCETPVVTATGAPEAIWRVLVVRDGGGAIRIESVEEIDVPSDVGPPQGALAGTHALAALDSTGSPLEVHPIKFPDVLLLESVRALEAREEIDLSGQEVSAVGYARVSGDVVTLAVVEPDGTVVSSREAPSPGDAVLGSGAVRGSAQEIIQAAAGSACSHVLILEGGSDAIWYPSGLVDDFPLRSLSLTQLAVVRSALGRLTATHCAGVGRIAFVKLAPRTGGKVVSWAGGHAGDVILINGELDLDGKGFDEGWLLQDAGLRAILAHTVIHEAAHATTYLLEGTLGRAQFEGDWAPTERALAEETIDNARLRGGFVSQWSRLHESFEAQGWARNYAFWPLTDIQVDALKSATPEQLSGRGFMSAYAGTSVFEDIAEVATWPIVGPLYREAGVPEGPAPETNDFGCIAMRAHDEVTVPQGLVAVFTKLAFLRDLGMLTNDAFDHCRGENTGLPYDTEGIVIYEDGIVLNEFTSMPEAGIGTRDDQYVFTMEVGGTADFGGENYGATLEMELDLGPTTVPVLGDPIPVEKVSWPRGVYSLALLSSNHFRLRMVDAPAGNFDVTEGWVLVAESSNERIVGSVFVREAFRFQAPIPVPQVFDPPLQFRFLLKN